ncbi:Annexin (Annexin) Family [Thraustotheca clavata]|uniref:Annexin (Annexin) Family n=1 Tax=Thraustotheca clavata TaxID=74557 RepID=A0A1V9ZC53_9STRA|nr:Annexin (Annexin) Family [Thraustotheca clavata]
MNIYPEVTYDADAGRDIRHTQSVIDHWCEEIHAACEGLGTDEDRLSELLGTKSPNERALIHLRYPELFNTSLLNEMKSETSGDYGKLLQLLAQPIEQAEAMIIRNATKGAGTTEKLLIPVFGGRTDKELNILKKAFFKLYEEDLVVTIADDLSGDIKTFYLAVLNQMAQEFNPAIHTQARAEELAEIIYKAGEGKWGTDESTFCNTLCSIPPQFLAAVNAAYARKHDHQLITAIEKEFGGKAEDAIVYHVNMILHPIETIVDQFEKTMKGIGTDEYGLSATLVRYQSLLPQVKKAYRAKYNQSLRDRIEGEASGDYGKLLLLIYDHSN